MRDLGKNVLLAMSLAIIAIIIFGSPPSPWPIYRIHYFLSKFIEPMGIYSSGRYFSTSRVEFVVGLYKIETPSGQIGLKQLVDYENYHSDLSYLRDSLMQQKLAEPAPVSAVLADSYGRRICASYPEATKVHIFRGKRLPLSPQDAREGKDVSASSLLNDIELLTIFPCAKEAT